MTPTVSLTEVSRSYGSGARRVEAVREVSFRLEQKEIVILTGPSGSGKSTILHLAGAMDRPTSGTVTINGNDTSTMVDRELTLLRRRSIGFIFQFFNLVPTLTVEENVSLPLFLNGERNTEATVASLLESLEISHRRSHYPWQLSGGEMQRTAIARALVHKPSVIIADEPTGNLDSTTGKGVLETMRRVNQTTGVPILMATHSAEAAAIGTRRLEIVDGKIVGDDRN